MKELLLKMLNIGSRLFLICLASALLLGILNSLTAPRILLNREKQEKLALAELISAGTPGNKEKAADDTIVSYYKVSEGSRVISYVLELNGSGYGGVMKLLANYKPGGELLSAKLMDNKETPGLGKKAESSSYMNKFTGKGGPDQPVIPTSLEELAAQMPSGDTEAVAVLKTGYDFVGGFPRFWEWLFGESKAGSEDSVTGATITFKGVSAALAAGSAYVRSHFGGTE
jgi:electron transport complex protein RnfG